jgi:iron(II)-dependent oxidoreductase
MERATAALLQGLRLAGHEAFILAAGPSEEADGGHVVRLLSLTLPDVVDDEGLRAAIRSAPTLARELSEALARCDVVLWVDALWGLGSFAPTLKARSVLMVHVLGEDLRDLNRALDLAPDFVTTPSTSVRQSAGLRGIDARAWRIVPNALLEPLVAPPTFEEREVLRVSGHLRLVARLGPEKGVAPFLRAAAQDASRPLDVALARAAFEPYNGSQRGVRADCERAVHSASHIRLWRELPWRAVPTFFAGAAVAVVPSRRESFGLVALEAMSAGTPVVCFGIGNLPELVGAGGIVVDLAEGPDGLLRGAARLLRDESQYISASDHARKVAERFRPQAIAKQLIGIAIDAS